VSALGQLAAQAKTVESGQSDGTSYL